MFFNYTIEIEATNYCNANCVFCANRSLKRPRGFLDERMFSRFILEQEKTLPNNIFRKYGMTTFPRVTFCGLGDPLLHPHIEELVKIAHRSGFYTQLVTNGALLTYDKLSILVNNGLDEIDISLHSLNSVVYNAITQLNIENVKKALLSCHGLLSSGNVKVMFWRIKHPDSNIKESIQDEQQYLEFIQSLGFDRHNILGPSEAWSRDGVVPESTCELVNDSPFWCNKLVFTLNLDWQGNVIVCCNDYNRESIDLGNVFDKSFQYDLYMKLKKDIFNKTYNPEVCRICRRWADNEILDILERENIDSSAFLIEVKNGFSI